MGESGQFSFETTERPCEENRGEKEKRERKRERESSYRGDGDRGQAEEVNDEREVSPVTRQHE